MKKLVDDCVSCQLSSSLRPHDAVSALGPMYDVHESNNLPKMCACDAAVNDLVNICLAKKNEMNLFVHAFMQKVVHVQSIIRDVRLQFPAFTEAMDRQADVFADLSILRGIAPAYRACLAEVIRRKSTMKLYVGKAGEYAERLAQERENEISHRSDFLRIHIRFIPRDVLAAMGLFDSPKPCEVNVAPFDEGLLDIDFPDLDGYAPDPLTRSLISDERSEEDSSVCVSGTSRLEVENARLRADLASAVARICSLSLMEVGDGGGLDEGKVNGVLKEAAEKTEKALLYKDEYVDHIRSALKVKEMQCSEYEKRIRELEQRLSDQYLRSQSNDVASGGESKGDFDCKSGVSGEGEVNMPEGTSVMEEAESKVKQTREGVDESMVDFSDHGKKMGIVEPLDNSMSGGALDGPTRVLTCGSRSTSELQCLLAEKSTRCEDMESRLKATVEQILSLQQELEVSRKLLEESQVSWFSSFLSQSTMS